MKIKTTNLDWQKQALDHHSNWFEVCVIANDYLGLLPPNATSLSSTIELSSTVLKDDKTTTVARHKIADESVIIKRYNPRNQWHKIKRALRLTRAKRCWEMSYQFAQAGLNVSRPIMMMEECFGPLRRNAFFLNAELDGEELLDALPKMNINNRELVKEALLDAFSKMEIALISHGDMKATNLIWQNNQLFFIDLDAAKVHTNKAAWTKAHAKDRKRFMKNWNDHPELLSLFDQL